MASKYQQIWTETEDQVVIRLYGTMTNRALANQMNRSVHSLECRVKVLRDRGLMPKPSLIPIWTEADDRYLRANYKQFTTKMLAEDLGRTVEAVNSRLRRLKSKGMTIESMPRGYGRLKAAEKARAQVAPLEVSTVAEREAMRDEVVAYLGAQIARNALALEQAKVIAKTITERVLKAPDYEFKRLANKPVAVIVQEAA